MTSASAPRLRAALRAALLASLTLLAGACARGPAEGGSPAEGPAQGPVAGPWRAALASPGGPLTFGLELEERASGVLGAVLVNGEERREAGAVQPIPGGVVIEVPPYRSRLVAEVEDGGRSLVGRWERDRGEGHAPVLAFAATAGGAADAEPRPTDEQTAALNGRWSVRFADDEDPAVGIFEAAPDGAARGTFLTTLGDYRYLAGRFDGTRLDLSCFDGAHAFLFSATLEGASLTGDFWSRDSDHTTWTATKDPGADLPDDFALTRWKGAGAELASLRFPDLSGTLRSLADPEYRADAKLLVVFGTWCPNCNDLTELLVELRDRYPDLGVLGLAFELGENEEKHRAAVRDYMTHHGADYPVLLGGAASKAEASAALPVLDRVRAFPTTVFMDRDGNVSAVHTGFSGPATGGRHRRLRQRFESEIESLLKGD